MIHIFIIISKDIDNYQFLIDNIIYKYDTLVQLDFV